MYFLNLGVKGLTKEVNKVCSGIQVIDSLKIIVFQWSTHPPAATANKNHIGADN